MELIRCSIKTALGEMQVLVSEKGICRLLFSRVSDISGLFDSSQERSHPLLEQLEEELSEYCRRVRRSFTLPLDLHGTAFQRSVWQRIQAIPYGRTITYKEIADELDLSRGSRAVGNAVAQNPLLILVPCHRVVGSSGSLTGFAGGLELKERLLELEGIRIPFGQIDVDAGLQG